MGYDFNFRRKGGGFDSGNKLVTRDDLESPDSKVRKELAATFVKQGMGFNPGGGFAVTGDSITQADTTLTANTHANTWATHAVLASGGSLTMLTNAGHGGYKSSDLLALFDAEVLSFKPQVVGIAWGTNDLLDANGKPTTTAANTRAAIQKVFAAGALPFLCTIPPQGVAALPAPAAPTLTASTTGGTMPAGTYYYRLTYSNGIGETTAGPSSSVTTTGTTSSVYVAIPWLEGSTKASVYLSTDNATWKKLTTVSPSSGSSKYVQSYTDTTGSATGAAPPATNTTAVAWNTTSQAKIKTINAWLRTYASNNGIILVDQHAILVDPTTGMYKTGYTTDGTHPTSVRQKYMGQNVWNTLQGFVRKTAPLITQDNADPLNLLPNGCLVNGSSSVPTSWTSYGGSTANLIDTLAAKTGFAGKAQISSRTDTQPRYRESQRVSVTPGDVLVLAFMMQTENFESGGGQVGYTFKYDTGTIAASVTLQTVDIGPAIWTTRVTVPSGAAQIYLQAGYTGPGQSSVGQVTIYNETASGLTL